MSELAKLLIARDMDGMVKKSKSVFEQVLESSLSVAKLTVDDWKYGRVIEKQSEELSNI